MPAAAAAGLPNIVLIISDDHGWTDYGFMGHRHLRTPNLDRLAAGSLVFPRGYVPASLCSPSLSSIITGLYPHQHNLLGNDPPGKIGSPLWHQGRAKWIARMESLPTLPRLLAKKGYVSLQTGKWWHGSYASGGFTEGMTTGRPEDRGRHGDLGLAIGREGMDPILDFIRRAQRDQKPFFLWYAPFLPHTPHNPPARLLEHYRDTAPNEATAKYWAMCEWFDETCGALLDFLDAQRLTDDTLILYVADNGWVQAAGGGSVRSKQSPYDAGLRTPILVRWPGRVAPGKADTLVSSIDLYTTALAAAEMEPPDAAQGINLLDERARHNRRAVYGDCYLHTTVDLDRPAPNLRWRWTVEGNWKLIVPAASDTKVELYDLAADPHEQRNLAAQQPDVVANLQKKLDQWWQPAP